MRPRSACLSWLVLAVLACAPAVDTPFYQRVLTLEDERARDAAAWQSLYELSPDDAARARVVRGVGRVRARELAPVLEAWWAESESALLGEEILFALGQTGNASAGALLSRVLGDSRPGIRARSAEALGKLGRAESFADLLPLLADDDAGVRGTALLAAVRLRGRRVALDEPLPAPQIEKLLDRLRILLKDEGPEVRWKAAYALAEIEVPGRLADLESVTGAPDPRSRLFVVRALGRLENDENRRRDVLTTVLETDEDPHVAAAAAAGLGQLVSPVSVRALLDAAKRRRGPADHHVRHAALAALGRLPALPPAERAPLRTVLDASLEDSSSRVRAAALQTRAVHLPDEAVPVLETWSARPDRLDRQAAARAAAHLPAAQAAAILDRLREDAEPAVAAAALEALASMEDAAARAREAALASLARPDLAVRGTALAVLERVGRAEDLPAIARTYRESPGADWIEVRVAAVQAAAALSPANAASFLREALGDPAAAVRGRAAPHLPDVPSPASGPDAPRRSSVDVHPVDDPAHRKRLPHVDLHTTIGVIELELYPEEAPRHVHSFLDRARAGLYDGLPFHRVVSGFVVQGLDPRGDGWGTGGVFLRDEINPVLYEAGTVGMPNAGPDSGGCQIFITHVPTPHLDGRYTVFGRVVGGQQIVNALDVGDVCLRVTIEP